MVNNNIYFDSNDALMHLNAKFESLYTSIDKKYAQKIDGIHKYISTIVSNITEENKQLKNDLDLIISYNNLPWYKRFFKTFNKYRYERNKV